MNNKKKLTIITAITSIFLFIIFLTNKLIFLLSTLKEILYSENSNYYNWRFGKVFYTKKGTGSPLLLIHDLNCTSSDYEWKELVNQYAENHTVYTIDLLGCGRSEKPKITYTNYLYVQLITDFIKNIVKQKVDTIATGDSASFVIMSCFANSELFNSLVLINPTDIGIQSKFPKYKHKVLKYVIDSPIIGTFIYNIIVSKAFIKDTFEHTYYNRSNAIKKRYIDAYNEAAHLGGTSAKYMFSSVKSYYTNINIVHALKEINNSIYLIGGEHFFNIEKIFNDYTTLNPSIETTIIKDTKKLPQLECPSEVYNLTKLYIN